MLAPAIAVDAPLFAVALAVLATPNIDVENYFAKKTDNAET